MSSPAQSEQLLIKRSNNSSRNLNLTTCEEVLTECAQVVEVQQKTILAQTDVIDVQEKVIETHEAEVKRLDAQQAITKKIAWGEAALLLLLLL